MRYSFKVVFRCCYMKNFENENKFEIINEMISAMIILCIIMTNKIAIIAVRYKIIMIRNSQKAYVI